MPALEMAYCDFAKGTVLHRKKWRFEPARGDERSKRTIEIINNCIVVDFIQALANIAGVL